MHTICRCIHQQSRGLSASVHLLAAAGRASFSASAALARKPSRKWAKEQDLDLDLQDDDAGSYRIPTRNNTLHHHHESTSSRSGEPWSRSQSQRLRSKYMHDQDLYEQALDLPDLAYADANTNTWPPSPSGQTRSRSASASASASGDQHQAHEPTLSFPSRRRHRSPARPIPLDDLLDDWLHLENIQGKAHSVGLKPHDADKVIRAFSATIRSSSHVKPQTLPRDVPSARSTLNHLWIQFLAKYVPPDQKPLFTALCESADLRHPKEWYPGARLMKRQIIMHVGPTNSGKTHGALAELASAVSGVYCGPLRLLAHEIHDRFTARGIKCSLITGEERREDPLAKVTACTVEMADLGKEYAVAVIDEIQMMADGQRGWAWTQALLGLRASRIYVCGEESAVPLVKRMLEGTGDEVVVKRFERLTPLKVSEGVVKGKLAGVQPGDCVVAFSRREVFSYKYLIEKENPGLKCAVVYGALPPETRAEQARLFNSHRESGYGVMVATDAVGMGLNLAINRVIFTTTSKYNGVSEEPLSISALKQIAGRAGRFGHGSAHGTVTAFHQRDLRYIHETLPQTPPNLTSAGLQPTPDMIEAFAQQLPNEPLTGLLEKFEALARLNGEMYFMCNLDDQRKLADRLKRLEHPMSIRDQYLFVLAPVNTRSESALAVFDHIADMSARKRALPLMAMLLPGGGGASSKFGLEPLGEWHSVFTEEVVRGMRRTPKSTRAVKDARAMDLLAHVVAHAQQEGEHVDTDAAAIAGPLDDLRPSHVYAPARSRDQLARLESVHRGILLYMWLANRFEGHATFAATPRAHAEWLLRECERAINLGLKVITESEHGRALRDMESEVEAERVQLSSPVKWGVSGSRKRGRVETEEARAVIEEV